MSNPFVKPEGFADGMAVIILERIEPFIPQYSVLGKAQCIGCTEWVWLGAESYGAVINGYAAPVCIECAIEKIPDDPSLAQQIGMLNDD